MSAFVCLWVTYRRVFACVSAPLCQCPCVVYVCVPVDVGICVLVGGP